MKKGFYVRAGTIAAGATMLIALSGLAYTSLASAANETAPTTDAATAITSSNATLNGTNGSSAATDSSFWVSTSTFSTASSTLPASVFSTADLGAQATSSAFSADLNSAVGLPAVTPDTTYFYAAWTEVDGVWSPGAVESFTTSAAATTSAPTVTGIAPMTGSTAGGTSVVITGTGFTGATAVNFGTKPGTITATTSATSITATSPVEAAGPVDVSVVTPNGTSATSSADVFTYATPVSTTTEPVISDVDVTTSGTSTAMITWTTDLPSTSQVMYGLTSSYTASSSLDSTLVTSHSVTINGLSEATLYHFDVQSTEDGNTATSADMSFMTGSSASTTPLAVDGVTTDQGTATADGTFQDGWLWVMHLTVPTIEDAFRMAFSDFTSTSSSSTIPADGDIQIYSPESSNASTSASAITETGNGYSGWMYLNGDTATSTAGRQIDVYINVAVPLGTAAGSYTTNFAAQSTPSSATSTNP